MSTARARTIATVHPKSPLLPLENMLPIQPILVWELMVPTVLEPKGFSHLDTQ